MKTIWLLLKDIVVAWNEDRAPRLAAALAFYTMFTLAPMLIVADAIAGRVFGQQATRDQIIAQIEGLIGVESARAIQDFLEQISASTMPATAPIIAVGTLLLGIWWVFGELQDALNTIWKVVPKPGRKLLEVLWARLVSYSLMLGVGFLLLVSLVLSAALAAFGDALVGLLPTFAAPLRVLASAISFGVITLLFAMIYKIVPDGIIAWGDVWIGAAVTALLYTIGKALISIYLGRSSYASSYGGAGSLVVILIYVYYSAQILFLGAEFTRVYAHRYGSRIVPIDIAVPATEEARAQQGLPL